MRKLLPAAALLLIVACSDVTAPPQEAASIQTEPLQARQAGPIPTRAEENPSGWASETDEELWELISSRGAVAVVGLRTPGSPRGSWQGKLLLSRAEFVGGRRAVSATHDVTLLAEDSLVAAVMVKLGNIEALRQLRRLPFVDYVEPVYLTPLNDGWGSGCSLGSPPPSSLLQYSGGDWHHAHWSDLYKMHITGAWARGAKGSGVTIGLIDTGISTNQPELRALFATGQSTGRWYQHHNGLSGGETTCSHGTRMAGVIAAPKNGVGPVGVAYQANLFTYRHGHNTWGMDGWNVGRGIDAAGSAGARVIALAMQVLEGGDYLRDKIRYWYWQHDMLFIGAAGTSNNILINRDNVVFPAEMSEVFAVTGTPHDDYNDKCDDCHYGYEVMLAAPIQQVTTGMSGSGIVDINGSSSAVAVIAGVAALVYSNYPGESRSFVIGRLVSSGHRYPQKSYYVGYGVVNARKAAAHPEPPPPPSDVNVTNRYADGSNAVLTWTTSPTAAGYRVYRKIGSASMTLVASYVLPPWTDTGVTISTTSCRSVVYEVRAFTSVGESSGASTGACIY